MRTNVSDAENMYEKRLTRSVFQLLHTVGTYLQFGRSVHTRYLFHGTDNGLNASTTFSTRDNQRPHGSFEISASSYFVNGRTVLEISTTTTTTSERR